MRNHKQKTRTSKLTARIYVDGANLFYTQKDLGWTIDWLKTKKYLASRWNVVEIKYYTGIRENDEKMKGFLRYLDRVGIIPVTKPLKRIKSDDKQIIFKSNFDVEMTTDILLERTGTDVVVIFSGDSDFDYLVKKLKDLGKETVVFSSRKMISWELKLSVNEYVFLEDLEEKVAKKTSARRRSSVKLPKL